MKRALLLISIVLLLLLSCSQKHLQLKIDSVDKKGKEITILNHTISDPEVFLATYYSNSPDTNYIPINLDSFNAEDSVLTIPLPRKKGQKLIFELYEENETLREHRHIIELAFKATGKIIWTSGKLIAISKGVKIPKAADLGVNQLISLGAKLLVKDMGKVNQLGSAEYIVQRKIPKSPDMANVLIIEDGEKVWARIKVVFS